MDTIEAQELAEDFLDDPLEAPSIEEIEALRIGLIILIAFNNTLKEVSK